MRRYFLTYAFSSTAFRSTTTGNAVTSKHPLDWLREKNADPSADTGWRTYVLLWWKELDPGDAPGVPDDWEGPEV